MYQVQDKLTKVLPLTWRPYFKDSHLRKGNHVLAERVFRLDGDVAIVTGSAAGIGRAIALTFAQCGAAVVVTDLRKEGAEAVAREIRYSPGSTLKK
jgi:hypothetical protein